MHFLTDITAHIMTFDKAPAGTGEGGWGGGGCLGGGSDMDFDLLFTE